MRQVLDFLLQWVTLREYLFQPIPTSRRVQMGSWVLVVIALTKTARALLRKFVITLLKRERVVRKTRCGYIFFRRSKTLLGSHVSKDIYPGCVMFFHDSAVEDD
jgi:hypothetical protein